MKYQNILYLHGLLAKPASDRIDYLQSKGSNVVAPTINYDQEDLLVSLTNEFQNQNIDCIIGFSAGGLFGFCLALIYGCDTLLFNPALSYGLIRQDTQALISNQKAAYQRTQSIILGLQDDIINPQTSEYLLEKYNHTDYCTIHKEADLGHRVDFQTFVRIWEAYSV